jgi:hypothetical protein
MIIVDFTNHSRNSRLLKAYIASPTSRLDAGIYFCQFPANLALYIMLFVFNILLCAREVTVNYVKYIVAKVSIPVELFRFHIRNTVFLFINTGDVRSVLSRAD